MLIFGDAAKYFHFLVFVLHRKPACDSKIQPDGRHHFLSTFVAKQGLVVQAITEGIVPAGNMASCHCGPQPVARSQCKVDKLPEWPMASAYILSWCVVLSGGRYADPRSGRGFVRERPDLALGGLRSVDDRGDDLLM